MDDENAVINTLQQEYRKLLPSLRKIHYLIESQIRWHLQSIIYSLKPHEKIQIKSRVKECDSAINSLRIRKEGIFDSDNTYTLLDLKDLVGLRILVFPDSLIATVEELIKNNFPEFKSDHIPAGNEIHVPQYYGALSEDKHIQSEVQITPMMIGLFWEIEHFVLYKPEPSYKGIRNDLEIKNKYNSVLKELSEFVRLFEDYLKSIKASK